MEGNLGLADFYVGVQAFYQEITFLVLGSLNQGRQLGVEVVFEVVDHQGLAVADAVFDCLDQLRVALSQNVQVHVCGLEPVQGLLVRIDQQTLFPRVFHNDRVVDRKLVGGQVAVQPFLHLLGVANHILQREMLGDGQVLLTDKVVPLFDQVDSIGLREGS